jgi:hypothetical protein
LVWRKRRWRCHDADCETKTWTEQVDAIAPRAVLTDRAKAEIARRVGADAQAVSRVAAAFGVSWDTAWRAFAAHVTPQGDNPARIRGVEALGIDETACWLPRPRTRPCGATGLVGVRRGPLADVIEGRFAHILPRHHRRRPRPYRQVGEPGRRPRRRRTQGELLGHRGRSGDPLYDARPDQDFR